MWTGEYNKDYAVNWEKAYTKSWEGSTYNKDWEADYTTVWTKAWTGLRHEPETIWAGANVSKNYTGVYSVEVAYTTPVVFQGAKNYLGGAFVGTFSGVTNFTKSYDGFEGFLSYSKDYTGSATFTSNWTKLYAGEVPFHGAFNRDYL